MKRTWTKAFALLILPVLLFSLSACGGEPAAGQLRARPEQVEHGPVGMDSISNIASISRLNDNLYSYGTSSYSRQNSNDDGFTGGNFLYVDEEGRYVICDVKGTGVITRIWMLANGVDGNTSHIQIYIDGEDSPTVDMSYNEFISGARKPFNDVFCVRSGQGGVHVCYLSMEFEKSVYVVMTEPNAFWQVDYQTAEGPTEDITSMTGEEDYTRETMLLENLGNSLAGYTDTYRSQVAVKAGKTAKILELNGPKQISYLEFTLDGLKLPADASDRTNENFRDILNGLKLVIHWDGEKTPSVDAPFSLLFGMGSFGYNNAVNSLMYGVKDDGTLYFYFPMPFEQSAEISVRNDGETDVDIGVNIGYCSVKSDFYNIGYFTTAYNNFYVHYQDPFEAVMLDVEGSGKVVSIQENIFGQVGEVWYEEGDHRFYIDGSITPQMIGTGTEDFYNGAGYFILNNDAHAKLGLHSLVFSGYTNYFSRFDGENAALDEGISCYRIFVTDPIHFRSGIKLTFEHGGGEYSRSANRTWNTNQTAGYEVLVCYYYQPVVKISQTDAFRPADREAAGEHGYTAADAEETYTLRSSFYGSFFMVENEMDVVKSSGEISFEMTLDPNNYGAVLYRIYDQYEKNLGAAVYVDGAYVGEWYKAGSNTTFRFADDFFAIPEAFTEGKTSVVITLKPDTENAWNVAEYRLYSRTDSPVKRDLPVSGKVYTISSGKSYVDCPDSEWSMDGSGAVGTAKQSGAASQDFRLIAYPDGTFFLICQENGALLSANGTVVVPKKYPASELGSSERWELIPDSGGYRIRNVESGLYLSSGAGELALDEKGSRFTFTEVTRRKLCVF